VAVAEILAVEGSIVSYFRKLAPSDNTASGIAPELMDNYIKSCGQLAIMCVIRPRNGSPSAMNVVVVVVVVLVVIRFSIT